MKLKELEIINFRTIEHLVLSMGDILALIGENNAGKSNILKALDLFFQESVRGISDEYYHCKKCEEAISIIVTFDRLLPAEKEHERLKLWVYNDEIKLKKAISVDEKDSKHKMQLFGWQAKPTDKYFDLDRFEEYKEELATIVRDHQLPEYFLAKAGKPTQASYKAGVKKHIENGLVEMGSPGWIPNPAGYKEVFSSYLPRYYFVPAVRDAQEESKTSQQTYLGKLINDLTARIVSKNPKFQEVKTQIDSLKKYLNVTEDGSDAERLVEIRELETTLTSLVSESIPDTKVEIRVITPELIDLFKDTVVNLNDSLPTSIDAKGHGLQRALVMAYIRAYAKMVSSADKANDLMGIGRNFILGIEEPELYLHPNGQRKMLEVLRGISTNDQVIYCTHSSFFVNLHEYKNTIIVRRNNNGPTAINQFTEDIFDAIEPGEKARLKKVFRYLSMFDISRSEVFFAKLVVLVEGDSEKFLIPYCAHTLAKIDTKYDLAGKNICVVECGGKNNIHIFMRVLNKFNIPYIVVHDTDPLSFDINKPDKTDKEKAQVRTFQENQFIKNALHEGIGRIIRMDPELENISGVSGSQIENHGKVEATFRKYDSLAISDYPVGIKRMIDLIVEWNEEQVDIVLS